jgi:hypothetical protein
MGKKVSAEYERFMDLLRRIVAVPKKEADEAAEKYKEREGDEDPEPS